jgi:hypothetical protein
VTSYALFGFIAAGPLRCCLLGECDMDGGIDDPRDGRSGVAALRGWGEPAEHAEAVHRAVEGVALFWGAQGAVVLNDVASGDLFEALCQDEAGDPGGMIGLPGVEDDGFGAPQVRREDPPHVAPDAVGDVGGNHIDLGAPSSRAPGSNGVAI